MVALVGFLIGFGGCLLLLLTIIEFSVWIVEFSDDFTFVCFIKTQAYWFKERLKRFY